MSNSKCAGQLNLFSLLEAHGTSLDENIEKFKAREVKAKEIFIITQIDKTLAYAFVSKYHYLGKKDFVCQYAFGLWCSGELVGVATYSPPAGVSTLKGWFGLPNDDLTIVELTRLAMLPQLNGCNATSYLLSHSIRELKKKGCRAVISLADASRHIGSIYQVCNFTYYGLSDKKTDFYRWPDMRKNAFERTKNREGVFVPRTRKHRYAYIIDKRLKCLYGECEAPKDKTVMKRECCGGGYKVFDARNKQWYSCPVCTGKLIKIDKEDQQ